MNRTTISQILAIPTGESDFADRRFMQLTYEVAKNDDTRNANVTAMCRYVVTAVEKFSMPNIEVLRAWINSVEDRGSDAHRAMIRLLSALQLAIHYGDSCRHGMSNSERIEQNAIAATETKRDYVDRAWGNQPQPHQIKR